MLDTSAARPITLDFPGGHSAQALWLSPHQTSSQALATLGIASSQPTLVVIGGASLMETERLERLQMIFNTVLAPLAQDLNLTVLDGGTDAGVMRMMGQSRCHVGGRFPLIGVLPQGKAKLPTPSPLPSHETGHDLEPNHTHFFLIPGQDWGQESPWLSNFATDIALRQPALTILINGGKVTLLDMRLSLEAQRPVLVLAGSGRLADEVVAAIAGNLPQTDASLQAMVLHHQPSGHLNLMDLALPFNEMRDRLYRYFMPTP